MVDDRTVNGGPGEEASENRGGERALSERGQLLQAVFENSLDAILLADDDARYVDANPAACALSGYSRDELLQLSVWDLTPEMEREAGMAAWREFIAAGALGGEYAIQREDGTVLDVEFRAVANVVPGLHMSVMRDIDERKGREEALRAINERLRTIIEASPAALVVLTLEGEVTLWSPAAEAIFGWQAEEVVGQAYPLADTPELAAEFRENLRRAAAGEPITGLETQRRRKDGRLIDVSMNVTPVTDRSGKVTSVLGLIVDITERKEAVRALQASEARYRRLFELLPAGVFTKDREGRYTSSNDRALTYTQKTPIGATDAELQPPDIAAELRANDLQVMERGERMVFEEKYMAPDGVRWLLSHKTPLRDAEGNVTGILGATQDITERKETEAKLRRSEEKYRMLVETAHDLIWSVDEEGVITFMNRAARRIYGREPQEMIGRPYTDFVPADEAARQAAVWEEMAAENDRITNYENWVLHKDGSRVLLSANAVLLRDEEGNVAGAMGTSQDITERKAMEEELAEYTKRLESLEALHRAILAIQPPEKTAETAIYFLSRLVDADRISAGLFSADHTSVRTLAAYSKGETQMGQGTSFDLDPYKAMIEHLKRGETHLVADLTAPQVTDPLLTRLRAEGLRTYMTIPLLSRGDLVGTLSIASTKPGAFTAHDEAMVHEVADQVAIAIRQAQLLEEERKQRRLAEALQEAGRSLSATLDVETLWDRLLDLIGKLVPYDSASVMAVEGERVQMTRMRGYREVGGEELAERVAGLTLRIDEAANLEEMVETGRAMVVPDTAADPDWIRPPGITHIASWAGAPIQIRGVTVAFFSVDKVEPNFYGSEHARILDAFAGQVSLALQNAHLFTVTRRRLRELSALYEAGTSLTQLSDPEEVGRRMLSTLESFMAFRQAGVIARDPQGGLQLLAYEARGEAQTEAETGERLQRALGAETSVVQWVIEHGQAVRLGDVQEDARYVAVDPEVQSELCVPLQAGGQTIGAINVEKNVRDGFDEHDERLLRTMAAQAAVALENARLFAAEQEAREQLSRLADYLQEAREAERTRIAREIHDEFGQALTALNMDVAWLSQRLQPAEAGVQEKVQEMEALIADSIQTMRRIATELRPGVLDDLGLAAALEWQTQEFSRRSGIACELEVDEEEMAVAGGVATACFRICQEALTNVARHAGADAVHVRLEKRPDEIVLTVRDDGRGIRDEEVRNSESLGLTGMAERARSFGGELTIAGTEGEGTTVRAHIPLAEKREGPK